MVTKESACDSGNDERDDDGCYRDDSDDDHHQAGVQLHVVRTDVQGFQICT